MGIAVLGPLVVDDAAGRLGPRDRVVLAALASRPGHVVTPDQLAEALWGDDPPDTWPKVVQGCVVRLRKALGAGAIETSRLGYRLLVPPDQIDSVEFERLVERARELLVLGEPSRAAYLLDQATALWRGTPLGELDGWEVGRVESARLEELRRDAEELRVDAAMRDGRSREVLGDAQRLVAQAPMRERRWALLALAQYRVGRQAEALTTLRRVRSLLAGELGIDPGPELVELEQAILRQDPSLLEPSAMPEASAACPYPGLLPYDVADRESFFGRDTETAEALERLEATGALVVAGPSGSGKSSLVRAGVAAALERRGQRVVVVTPGSRPLESLVAVSSLRVRPVLVVDQCEEAVTLCSDPEEQSAFFAALASYAEQAPLVVALRADRMGEVSAHASFARVVERGLYLLGAMGVDELRACVEGPAHQAGLLLEPGLVDLLVHEVAGEPGALPLLSHALRETWLHREGRTLTVAGYQATGGIQGAVARSAEEVYESVEPGRRAVLRDLVLRLVVPATDGEVVRSRMPRRMLADDAAHREVVARLVDARLVTSDDGVLELAHEALARAWPRLRQWLEDDTEGRRILGHLSASADAWDSMGRPDSELYRGVRLAQALDWRAQSSAELAPVEEEFLDASGALVDAEVSAAREQVRREAATGRRTRRLATGLAVALVLALLAAGLATWYQRSASDRAREATAAARDSDANGLAAISKSVAAADLSLLLAAQALRTANTPATQDGLLSSLVRYRRAEQVVGLGQPPQDVELGDNGRTLFVATLTGVIAWDVGTRARPRTVVRWAQPEDIAASPTGDLVALWAFGEGETPLVGVFDSRGRRHLSIEGLDQVGGYPTTFGFSRDGRRLYMGVVREADDGRHALSVREYDVASGERLRTRTVQRMDPDDDWLWTSFADDGSRALSWALGENGAARAVDLRGGVSTPVAAPRARVDQDWFAISSGFARSLEGGQVELYDGRGRLTQRLVAHKATMTDVVVSPDRTWAATADESGIVLLWAIDPRSRSWSPREELIRHSGGVAGLSVDRTGDRLVTVAGDGTAVSWDVSPEAGFGVPLAALGDRWVSNRPQVLVPGEVVVAPIRAAIAAGDLGGRVSAVFVEPETGRVLDEVGIGATVEGTVFGSSVAVSPDRRLVAVTHGTGTVVLDARTHDVVARIVLDEIAENGDRHPEYVWSAAWTRDGSRLLLGAAGKEFDVLDGNLAVVDTSSWQVQPDRIDVGGPAQTMELSPDGKLLAVGLDIPPVNDAPSGVVNLLDPATEELVGRLRMGRSDLPVDLSFSPDGTALAVATLSGDLYLFDVGSRHRLHDPTKVHNGYLQQVEWLDDRNVVTAGSDGMVALFDTRRGLLRATMPASADARAAYTYLLSASRDEVAAVSGGAPGRRYSLDPRQWLDHACDVAGRQLSRDEWASYLPGRSYARTCPDR